MHANKNTVYCIVCVATGLAYVGRTNNVTRRWSNHLWHLRRGSHHCQRLQRAWKKHGEGFFNFQILETGIREDQILIAECRWMLHFAEIFNTQTPAQELENNRTYVHSLATRQAISASRRAWLATPEGEADRASRRGKPRSSEIRAKMSATIQRNPPRQSWLGRKTTDEHRTAISQGNKGKPKSEEHCRAMRRGWAERNERLRRESGKTSLFDIMR